MMQNMFVSASRPFYHSADMLELSAIPDEKYIPFIVGNFNKFGHGQTGIRFVSGAYLLYSKNF